MKRIALMSMMALLVACAGKEAASTRNELAAQACDAYAKGQLGDKTYKLDHVALAASMADAGEGASFLRGPIVIEPGLSGESAQTLECTVRFVEGKDQPDVLKMQFIW